MSGPNLAFSYSLRSGNWMTMEVQEYGPPKVAIGVNPDEVLRLFDDMLSDFDMLNPLEQLNVTRMLQTYFPKNFSGAPDQESGGKNEV